jgi:hypothetical protein
MLTEREDPQRRTLCGILAAQMSWIHGDCGSWNDCDRLFFLFCGSLPAAGLSGALCTGGIKVWRLTDPVGAWKEAEVSHW